jgi:hypothetical protein
MTGRGRGYCAGNNVPGFMDSDARGGWGFGRGGGWGFGRGGGWGFGPGGGRGRGFGRGGGRGWGFGRGGGRGWGFGRGRWGGADAWEGPAFAAGASPDVERSILSEQASWMEGALAEIKRRMRELGDASDEGKIKDE